MSRFDLGTGEIAEHLANTDMDAEKPRRRIEVRISLGADDRKSAAAELHRLAELIRDGGTTGVMGGFEVGLRYEVTEDEAVTHDSYFAALESYLDETRGLSA